MNETKPAQQIVAILVLVMLVATAAAMDTPHAAEVLRPVEMFYRELESHAPTNTAIFEDWRAIVRSRECSMKVNPDIRSDAVQLWAYLQARKDYFLANNLTPINFYRYAQKGLLVMGDTDTFPGAVQNYCVVLIMPIQPWIESGCVKMVTFSVEQDVRGEYKINLFGVRSNGVHLDFERSYDRSPCFFDRLLGLTPISPTASTSPNPSRSGVSRSGVRPANDKLRR